MNPEATMHLITILEKTISPDKNELEAAQNFLEQAAQSNLPEFMKTLSDILHHGGNSPVARMAAGLQLKNKLTSKDETVKVQYQARWLALPEDTRTYIKNNILATLGTENNRPSSSAQCVAYVAVVELPNGQWPDLIAKLLASVVAPTSTEMMKEATLEAIGYICSEISHEVLVTQANEILTAIIHGMRSASSLHVRLAATNALHNSLEFTRGNFDRESERNYIMEVVCEATQCSETQVRVAALQCLVKIMSLYYHYMEPYMGQALFPITLEAMKSDVDAIALQGIEFWSNVSDEEVDLSIEESEAGESGQPPMRSSKYYAKGALQYLIPVLMTKLTKQEELDDEDDWNPSKAAGVCLMLLSSCCEDDIVPHVLPFVKENIKSPDWRYRDAAIMAFGSILSGLEASTLKPLVEQAMPTLIELMYDQSVVVRDTAAWTFGRICEIVPDAAINETYLKPLLEAFVNALKQEPRVAANVCWAFGGLAEAAYEQAVEMVQDGDQPETYCLSSCFQYIVQRLLETTDRTDGAQANLRSAAYEALMEMVKNSPKDCYMYVQQTTMVILERLNQVLQMEGIIQTNNDRAQYQDLQGLLCATLQSVLRKVTPQDAPQISDSIMSALLQMFSSDSGKSGGVQEDALMAVSTLVEVLGDGFIKYMDSFKPFLFIGLKNHAEYQVCIAAVGLVGDICRAIKRKVLEYCDEIMMVLLENLGDNSVHRSVKPHIFQVFGDISLSIGPDFKKYLDVVLQTLYQASLCDADQADYEMLDYINELREAVLSTYSGVIQGLKGNGPTPAPDVAVLEPHLVSICSFLNKVAEDPERLDGVTATAAGLIGDLCSTFGARMLPVLDTDPLQKMLMLGRKNGTQRTKTLSSWAAKEIRKIKNSLAPASCCSAAKISSSDGMDLDDVLPQVGEFGRYQKVLLLLVCLPACIPCGFCAFNQLFMADVPPHWCRVSDLHNLTQHQRRSIAIPQEVGTVSNYSSCIRYSVNWTELLNSTEGDLLPNSSWPTEPCTEGWEFDSTYPTSIVVDFELVCERDIYPTIGLAALNIGGPIGVYSFGILNDRIGRKKSYFCCLTISIVGGILTAFAQNFWEWALYRLIVGLTVPAAYQIPFIISLELVGPNYRSFVTVLTCLFYTMGLVLLAGVTYFVREWRPLALYTSTPFLLYYLYWLVLPESPRWLLAKGQLEKANAILEKLASTNGKQLPETFKLKLKQRMMMQRTKSEEQRLQDGPSVTALWKTPNMRLKTILITLNWLASEMVYVGLSYYGPALGSEEHVSFLLSCLVEIPSYICCCFFMDVLGRRWPLCLSMVLSGVSCVLTVLVPPGEETLTMILYLFSKFTISASFLIIYPFAGELYPTQLRGVGIGTSAYIGGIGLIIIPFITYLGRENLVLPLVIMGSVSAVVGLSALRLPETLHQRLPQTVEEGEEFGKEFGWTDCLRCIPLKPSSRGASYVDLTPLEAPVMKKDSEDAAETEEASELTELKPRNRPPLLRRATKLVRQTSLMETNLDASGSMQMTYWF